MSKPPFRINVNLSDDAYETLKKEAEAAGLDMSQFVRNALQVYTYLKRQAHEGSQVYIGRNQQVERELLIP